MFKRPAAVYKYVHPDVFDSIITITDEVRELYDLKDEELLATIYGLSLIEDGKVIHYFPEGFTAFDYKELIDYYKLMNGYDGKRVLPEKSIGDRENLLMLIYEYWNIRKNDRLAELSRTVKMEMISWHSDNDIPKNFKVTLHQCISEIIKEKPLYFKDISHYCNRIINCKFE